jgi:predicted RND superfamily exporter protein
LAKGRPLRDRWIDGVLAHHRLILVVAVLVTSVAAVLASRLHVDSDLRRLLPQEHPVVESLERVERTLSGIGSVNVVVKGGSAEQRKSFAKTLATELDGHELLANVDYRLPSGFFAEHALYYLTDAEMEALNELVQAWTHYELCTQAPDVCVTDPDPKAPDNLRAFVEAKESEAWQRTGFRDFYEREGVEALVVLLHPVLPSSELDFAKRVTAEMRRAVAEIHARSDAPWAGGDMTYNIVGPYITKADGHETIRRDMVRSGAVGLTGVVLILYLLFRSVRAVLILLFPLLCGVTWSLGATQLVLGHLNSMTSLISTVVLGMGIDAGIHFFRRAKLNRVEHGNADSIRLAFRGLIVPLLVASSTTIGAFLIMAISEFPAFEEFGIIAAMGVALCLVSMVTVLPSLAFLVGIKRHEPRKGAPQIATFARVILARPGLLFAVVVAVTVVSFQGVRRVGFEYDGRRLQSDRARAATEEDTLLISKIFGKDIHAGMLIVPSVDDARRVIRRARERHEARKKTGDTVVAELFGIPDLLPPEGVEMAARREQIEELSEVIPETAWERIRKREAGELDDKEDGRPAGEGEGLSTEDAKMLRRMLNAQPFAIDDLPKIVLSKVRGSDGAYGLFAYPDFDAADIQKGVEFLQETEIYLDDRGRDTFVGETTVYAAMYLMMRDEAPVVLGMAAVLIAALVFWQLRSLPQMLLTLLPLGLGMWWLVALMGATGIKFTLFNLPILPAIMGIGVDNGVYLTDRIRRSRGEADGIARSLDETGGAILAATATTAVGFASFLVADSGGLRGIGSLAVLGICLAALAAVLVLPTLTALGERRRRL